MEQPDELVIEKSSAIGDPLAYHAKSREPVEQGIRCCVRVRLDGRDEPNESAKVVLEDEDVEGTHVAGQHVAEIKVDDLVTLAGVKRMPERTRYHRAALRREAMNAGLDEGLDVLREGIPRKMGFDRGLLCPPATVSPDSRMRCDEDAKLQGLVFWRNPIRTAEVGPHTVCFPERFAWLLLGALLGEFNVR